MLTNKESPQAIANDIVQMIAEEQPDPAVVSTAFVILLSTWIKVFVPAQKRDLFMRLHNTGIDAVLAALDGKKEPTEELQRLKDEVERGTMQ